MAVCSPLETEVAGSQIYDSYRWENERNSIWIVDLVRPGHRLEFKKSSRRGPPRANPAYTPTSPPHTTAPHPRTRHIIPWAAGGSRSALARRSHVGKTWPLLWDQNNKTISPLSLGWWVSALPLGSISPLSCGHARVVWCCDRYGGGEGFFFVRRCGDKYGGGEGFFCCHAVWWQIRGEEKGFFFRAPPHELSKRGTGGEGREAIALLRTPNY